MMTTTNTTPRLMPAKFAGRCACGCGSWIVVGQTIAWSRETGARLQGCATARSARPSSPVRRPLRNGDEYTSRRTGERAIFGCSDCTRLGRMCRSCQHDDE